MFVKPAFDAILQQMLCEQVIDGTTVEAAFFDGRGVLVYPWRAQIEALVGREKHTLRNESRSWPVADKALCSAMRLLSELDLSVARTQSNLGRSEWIDHHLLAEVNDKHFRTYRRASVDRVAACMSLAAELIAEPCTATEYNRYVLEAAVVMLERLPASGIPFDGDSLVQVEAECTGLVWGIYEVPASWSKEDIDRASWRL